MTRVLVFTPYYFPGYMSGGIARTILNTTEWLGEEFSFSIITQDRDLGSSRPYFGCVNHGWMPLGNSEVYYLAPDQISLSSLVDLVNNTPHDVLHLNSFFDPVFTFRLLLLIRLGRIHAPNVILSPRGEFVEGPLRIKGLKKRLYIEMSKLAGFYGGQLRWHASSEHEANGIAHAMRLRPADIRIAIDLPIRQPNVSAIEPLRTANLKVVFFSRLTREKNLDGALRILKKVRSTIYFDILGPTEDPLYWAEIQTLLKTLPPNIHTRYLGSVTPEEVSQVLAGYDVLFLPSHGENYGHVIAEAISVGTRVLISQNTPWRDLEIDGVGWDLDLANSSAFVEILDELAANPIEHRVNTRKAVRDAAAVRLFDPLSLEHNRRLYAEVQS